MMLEPVLAFGSAGLGAILAIGSALKARRLPDRWAFAAGMAALSAERCFAGLMAGAVSPNAAYHWQSARLAALGLFPGVWLLFSLSYARGNAQEFRHKWRYAIGVAFVVPALIGFLLRSKLIASTELLEGSRFLLFRLSAYGGLHYLILLVS